MVLDIQNLQETANEHFKGGEGTVYLRAFFDGLNRIMLVRIPKGASIGMHTHETNSEIFHVLAGKALVKLADGEETVEVGQVHYCPKGIGHETISVGEEDLLLMAVVP